MPDRFIARQEGASAVVIDTVRKETISRHFPYNRTSAKTLAAAERKAASLSASVVR
jgi:hypothetical protein